MLSKRLQTVYEMIDPCDLLIDIGSDHAYLAIELIKNNKVQKVICAENKSGPLLRGLNNVKYHKLSDAIEFVNSDGVQNISSLANTWVIAGMGSETIMKIIEDSIDKAKLLDQIIIQPQSKHMLLRDHMNKLNFEILDESVIQDRSFYNVLKYRYNPHLVSLTDKEVIHGKLDYLIKSECFYPWIEYMVNKYQDLKDISETYQQIYLIFNQVLQNNQFQDMDEGMLD